MMTTFSQGKSRQVSIVVVCCIAALFAGIVIAFDPVRGGVAVLAFLFAVLTFLQPIVGIYGIVASLVIGQLIRIPAFGAEGAILPNDLLIPGVVAGWFLRGILQRRVVLRTSPLSWPFATMAFVFFLTFIAGTSQVPFLTSHERLASSLYIFRWLEYVALFFVVADIVSTERASRRLIYALISAGALLAVLGFIQLRLFPDFRFMVPRGWDPHIGRLLSTWFDPNFLGGYFSFMVLLTAGIASFAAGTVRKTLWILVAMFFAALLLTFSRSAYVSLVAGVAVLTFVRSKRILLLVTLALALVVVTVPRVQERVQGALNVDATARLRIVSWQNALTVAKDYPVTGIGYNTYRYVQLTHGFIKDTKEHSAGGSDSSLLTMLVTAGPAGLLVYLWILWGSLSIAWSSYQKDARPFVRGVGIGAFAGIVALTAHSFFTNSLLYPHIMEVYLIILGVLVAMRPSLGLRGERP